MIKNNLNIIKKRLLKKFNKRKSFFFLNYSFKGILDNNKGSYNDNFFYFLDKNLNPSIRKYQFKNYILFVCGNPVINEKLNPSSKNIFEEVIEKKNYKNINGSFIFFIYNKKNNDLLIINDRFASYKLYFTNINDIFFASSSFKLIYELKREHNIVKINYDSIMEFIYFRQIFGDDTFEKDCKFLDSASLLYLKKNNITKINKYWEPTYFENKDSRKILIEKLTERIKKSVQIYTSDNKNHGLLLSGGLDSRCILGVSKKKLSCFTITPTKNNEFYIAKSLANLTKNKHFFLLNKKDPLNSKAKLDNAIFHLGGSFNYAGFDLINYKNVLSKNTDTILMGLHFDFFYKALYLPKKNISFFGKNFLYKKLNNLETNIASQFVNEIGFKLKTSNPFTIFKNKNEVKKFKERILYKFNKIKRKGISLNAKGYSLWEYFYYQNLSRNFNFSMIDTLSTFIDVRSPALENDLFDLAINIPAEYKINGNLYNDALNKLCPELMEIDYANTNIKAKHSLKKQNIIKIFSYAKEKIFKNKKYKATPGWKDRSWNSPKDILNKSKKIKKKIVNLKKSKILTKIEPINKNKLNKIIKDQMKNKKDSSDLLNLLLTIDRFFK